MTGSVCLDESEEGAELPAGYHDEDDEHKDEDDAEIGHEGWSFHTRPGHEVGGASCCFGRYCCCCLASAHLFILFF